MINNFTVREYINKKSANLLLGWCIEKYGPSKYNNLKTLKIQIDPNHIHFGMYEPCQNAIILNPKRHRSLLSWCSTVIHEYTHFKQDMEKYGEYRTSYEKHPYEITCNKRGYRDQLEARRWLIRKLRNNS